MARPSARRGRIGDVTPPAPAPADTAAVRRHNLALVLRRIADGPCARTDVAAATGLVHASVTGLTAELLERGLVREVGAAATGGRGRPRRLLELVPGRVLTIAAQVTLERVETMAADLAGGVVHRSSAVHRAPFGDADALAAAVAREVRLAADAVRDRPDAHLARVVVAMAGPITGPGDTVAAAIDFGWRGHTDLRALVSAHLPRLDRPLDVVNDANVAALAEYHASEDELPYVVAYLKADTGVGGGLLIGGRIHAGAHGAGGEIGHMPIAFDGPPCPCGARGCLAQYVGPEPLLATAGLAALRETAGTDAALAELDRRLRAADPAACEALRDAGTKIAAAILAVAGLTDAGEVILGGYLADWFPWLRPGIDETLSARRTLVPDLALRVTPGTLGREATLRGAVESGRLAVLDDPTGVPVVGAGVG